MCLVNPLFEEMASEPDISDDIILFIQSVLLGEAYEIVYSYITLHLASVGRMYISHINTMIIM